MAKNETAKMIAPNGAKVTVAKDKVETRLTQGFTHPTAAKSAGSGGNKS